MSEHVQSDFERKSLKGLRPVDGRWQKKPGGVSGKPGRPGPVKKKIVRAPRGSGPFTDDEIARGYRFHPLDTSPNNPEGAFNAGKNIDRLLRR